MNTPVRDDAQLVENYEPEAGTFRIGFKALNIRSIAAAFGNIQRVLLVAARHLMRAIPAEKDAAGGRIKPHLSCNNYVLVGPAEADDLPAHANQLMVDAGVQLPLRSDCIMGIELVFSLHATTTVDLHAYFAACVEWVTDEFSPAPVISAVVHLDEQHPHLHVIVLPLIGSSMQGGKVMGYQGMFKRRQRDFYLRVGKRFGLAEPAAKITLSRIERENYANSVVDRLLTGVPTRKSQELVREELLKLIAPNPYALGRALGVSLRKDAKSSTSASSPTDITNVMDIPDAPLAGGGVNAYRASTSSLCYDVGAAAPAPDCEPSALQQAREALPPCVHGDAEQVTAGIALDPVMTANDDHRANDFVRVHDDDQLTSNWNADTGEFMPPPPAPTSYKAEAQAAVRQALQALERARYIKKKETHHG